MKIIVFSSPERKHMLDRLLIELMGYDVTVIDDHETFGKKNFWKRYKKAFDICRDSSHDWFMFLPDDIIRIDFELIEQFKQMPNSNRIVLNITSDNREECWGNGYKRTADILIGAYTLKNQGFYDCGGIMHRNALEGIDMEQIREGWFNRPEKSSGVGHQLTAKFRRKGVPMYRPFPSLCYHGNHESVMHPEERKKNPLISK